MEIPIHKLAKLFSGHLFAKKAEQDPRSPIAVIFISDISDKETLQDRPATYDLATRPKAQHFIQKGDILIQAKGKARIIYVSRDVPNTIASSNFIVVRSDPNQVLGRYLAWALQQEKIQSVFEKNQQGQNMPTLSIKVVKALKLDLPSLSKQRKIVELLETKSNYDKLIQGIQAQYNKLIQTLAYQTS
ncbi:MAG: restriction endonuclease subunit S [Deltaproteobacteria bacterium]|nr:restriction endonuclease subunit S [Deltaproteobacteria bacterium]